MELPHIGEQCSDPTCRQLDFLPFVCPLCKKTFCSQHQKLSDHNCPEAASLDVKVPVCPLCDQAVPAPRGQAPDIAISLHLDNNCVVKKERIFKNKCAYQGCRKKELMPIQCPDCSQNFCIPHRHPNDHNCTKVTARKQLPPSNNGGMLQALRDQAASRFRFSSTPPTAAATTTNRDSSSSWQQQVSRTTNGTNRSSNVNVNQLQGGLSEADAMAIALAQSQESEASAANTTNNKPPPTPRASTSAEEEAMIQQALQNSLRDSRQQKKSDCSIS